MTLEVDQALQRVLKVVMEFSDVEIDTIIGKLPNDLTKVRLKASLQFLYYTNTIEEKAYTYKLLGTVFILESLLAAQKSGKLQKIQKLLRENLIIEDKKMLLREFLFSREYRFKKESIWPLRHLMFEDFDKDTKFKERHYITEEINHCSGSKYHMCYCLIWLNENIETVDGYIDILIRYIYDMRNAVVHESFPVLFFPSSHKDEYPSASYSGSLIDVYPVKGGNDIFRAYQVFIQAEDFFKIIKNCIKNYLKSKL